jgi:MFS family permease
MTTSTLNVAAVPTDGPPPAFPPLTRPQVRYAAVVALLAWTFAVYDLITFGNLLPAIQAGFGWTPSFASFVATLISLGSLVVALIVGPLVDLFGRRLALFVTTGGAALSSGLAAFVMGPVSLVLFRSLSGFGMSEQAVNAAYLNEIFDARRKGVQYGIIQAGWPLGVMLSAGLAALLQPLIGWRGVFVVGTFPLIVIFFLRRGLKESPYFLKIRHLRALRRNGSNDRAEALGREWNLDLADDRRNTYAELFTPALRRHSIALGAMFFFKIIADSQMTVLATSILGQSKGIALSGALWIVVAANVVACVGYVAFGWLGDRIGRRETVMLAQVAAAVATLLLLFAAQGVVAVVACYSLVLFFAQGAAAPLFAYIGESFPTRVRGSGAAYINVAGPIGGIFGPLIYGLLLGAGFDATLAASSGAVAALIAAVCLFGSRSIRPRMELAEISH